MAEILFNLDSIKVNLGGKEIFADLGWEVQYGHRIGLVGANGAGKSTLLKVIAGELEPEAGTIFRAPGLTWGRLEQEPSLPEGKTILEEAMTAMPELADLEAKLARLEAKMGEPEVYGDPGTLEKVMKQHERLMVQFDGLDGSRFKSRVKESLTRLGMGEAVWDRPVHVLSGGQKKLIMLAKLAVRKPRVLLLDEPDNHLDIPAKRLLERFINQYDGTVIIISHDRYLLDDVATHIVELEAGRLTIYHGNYSAYTNERELRRLRQQQLYTAQQKEIARIEAAIARFELWASMVIDERHIRQARSRQKMLDKMDRVEKVVEARRMQLDLAGGRGSNKVIEFVDVAKTLPDGTPLWLGLNEIIWHNERVGLVGPNGVGKSMLLKQIMDVEGDFLGEIKVGPSNRIGYYSQENETLDFDRTLLMEIRQTAPLREETVVAFLHKFLFSYDQIRGPIRDLSGGERSRLQLAKLVLSQPNLLLLDEPTNNLDITSIEVLEETINEFEGTVLVISHDRFFLDKVVDRVIELKDGMLSSFVGGYTDYLDAAAGQ